MKTLAKNLFLPPPAPGGFLAPGNISLIPAFAFTWLFPCVSMCSFLLLTRIFSLGSTLISYDYFHRYQGLWFSYISLFLLGSTIQCNKVLNKLCLFNLFFQNKQCSIYHSDVIVAAVWIKLLYSSVISHNQYGFWQLSGLWIWH